MNWSVEEYLEGLKKGGKGLEETLLQNFPPGETELITVPAVILDRNGKILLWYLPRLLGRERQVSNCRDRNNRQAVYIKQPILL
jgi:hypothetical protein